MSRFKTKYLKSEPYLNGIDFGKIIDAGVSITQSGISAISAKKNKERELSALDRMQSRIVPKQSSSQISPVIVATAAIALVGLIFMLKKGKK